VVSRRHLVWILVGSLIAVGYLLLLVSNTGGFFPGHVRLGFLLGTCFGHTTLAAAWTALGPSPLIWRGPLSLLWVTLLVVAIVTTLGGPTFDVATVLGGCLLGQWILVQIPLWGLVWGYGLRLRYRDEAHQTPDPRDRQFGVRQLMIVTAIVGVLLGVGRLAVTNLAAQFGAGLGVEMPAFIFLAVAAIVMTLPLLLAVLLPRLAVLATPVILILIVLATFWELALLRTIHGGPGPDERHLIWINAFTVAWILTITVVVRLSGYRFGTSAPRKGPK
jgi:hypothetical protein